MHLETGEDTKDTAAFNTSNTLSCATGLKALGWGPCQVGAYILRPTTAVAARSCRALNCHPVSQPVRTNSHKSERTNDHKSEPYLDREVGFNIISYRRSSWSPVPRFPQPSHEDSYQQKVIKWATTELTPLTLRPYEVFICRVRRAYTRHVRTITPRSCTLLSPSILIPLKASVQMVNGTTFEISSYRLREWFNTTSSSHDNARRHTKVSRNYSC